MSNKPIIQQFTDDINRVINKYRDCGLKSSQLQIVFLHSFLDLWLAMKAEKDIGMSDEDFPGHDSDIKPGFGG